MSEKKQLTLFGTVLKQKTKKYFCDKDPQGDYECFIERYCLHQHKNGRKDKIVLVEEAQKTWKEEYAKAKDRSLKVEEYLELRPEEIPFVRYIDLFVFTFHIT